MMTVAGLSGFVQTIYVAGTIGVWVAGILAALVFLWLGARVESRRAVVAMSLVLLLALIGEYLLGSSSFIVWDDEGDTAVPVLIYASQAMAEGRRFAHEWAGGIDAYAMLATGFQHVSLERIALNAFPAWVVIALHKVLIAGVGLAGGYLVAHRMAGASPATALFLAAVNALAETNFLDQTLFYGVNWSVLPFIFYVFGQGLWGPRGFQLGILVTGLAALSQPTHIMPSIGITAVAALVFADRIRPAIAIFVLAMMAIACLINWSEAIYAFAQQAESTSRGAVDMPRGIFTDALLDIRSFADPISRPELPAGLLGLIALGLFRDRWFHRGLASAGVVIAAFLVAKLAPWELAGLTALKGITWTRILAALDPIALLLCARALAHFEGSLSESRARLVPALVFGLLITALCWQKGTHLYSYLNFAGQVQFHGIRNLAAWPAPEEGLFRAITMRMWRPEPNIVSGIYGRDSFDGTVNLAPRVVTDYWNRGIFLAKRDRYDFPEFMLEPRFFDPAQNAYRLDHQLSFVHLAIANVGYVISGLPMVAAGLREISAPPPDEQPRSAPQSFDERIAHYERKLTQAWRGFSVYVYRVEKSLPRAFGAEGVVLMDDTATVDEFAETVRVHAIEHRAVMRRADAPSAYATGAIEVLATRKTNTGYVVDVNTPAGGVLVINVPFNRFWRAAADGRPVPVASANLIHTAVVVPPGASHVSLVYARQLLHEQVFAVLLN